jgi:hypothetical protein
VGCLVVWALVYGHPATGPHVAVAPTRTSGRATIGTDRLLVKSNFSPAEVTQWLRDHDNHPWGAASMSYQVRGPTHDNHAEIETIYSFVRPYPTNRVPMNNSIALDEDTPTPLTFGEASDEEIVASGCPSNTKQQPKLASGHACPTKIPRSAPPPAPGMPAYDAMDADPKSATVTPRGSLAELPPSLVSRMQAAVYKLRHVCVLCIGHIVELRHE